MGQKKKLIASTIIGNIVEYYDFGMYAVFASNIGAAFFPYGDKFLQHILTFAIFAVGFLMRPIGGIIFGHIGDSFGRKVALRISIIGMAIATLGIALLPEYKVIGIIAPITLIIIRLVQGICIGGEGSGAAIYIIEHLPIGRIGLVGSIVMASNIVGTLLANGIGIIIIEFFGLNFWTWRLGFAFGAFMGIIGAYFRGKNEESPVFKQLKENKSTIKFPIRHVIAHKKFSLIAVVLAAGAATSISYLLRGYLNTFYYEVMGYSQEGAMYLTSFALCVVVLFLPLCGYLGEIVGRANLLVSAAFCVSIFSTPLFAMLANLEHNYYIACCGLFFISILCAALCAPLYPYAIKLFTPELRYSGVAFSYNIGNALFGGTTPLICTLLIEKAGHFAPIYYLMLTSGIFIVFNILSVTHFRRSIQYNEDQS